MRLPRHLGVENAAHLPRNDISLSEGLFPYAIALPSSTFGVEDI